MRPAATTRTFTCFGTIRSSASRDSSLPFLIHKCAAFATLATHRRLAAAYFWHASGIPLRLKIHKVDLS
jgi:hypothetical protein